MSATKFPMTSVSGAYVDLLNRSNAVGLRADVPQTDRSVVLELCPETPGNAQITFTQGGIPDNFMPIHELERTLVVLHELLAIARYNWPQLMRSSQYPPHKPDNLELHES